MLPFVWIADNNICISFTAAVRALKMYYLDAQLGTNPCAHNHGDCQHLCFGLSATKHVCKCAIGYYADPQNAQKCIGEEEFLLYSVGHELKGQRLSDQLLLIGEQTKVLGPLSRVSLASNIDYHIERDLIFWSDNEKGTITSIKRDGTERRIIIDSADNFESSNTVDWPSGIAVDWVAQNIYWSDEKRNIIEVARLNGSSRYVVLSNVEKPKALAIDPVAGYLFYAGDKRIGRIGLDGSQPFILANQTVSISNLAVDIDDQVVYWCEPSSDLIMRVDYDGNRKTVMLNHSIENPVAIAVLDKKMYWADNAHDKGSIKWAPLGNLSEYTTLTKNEGNSLKDLKLFSRSIQKGTNNCSVNNGGCEQLCLFNGTHPICACSHSMVSPVDGRTCQEYDMFLVYSRVTSIDSIHMTDHLNMNGPLPPIRHPTMLRNTIAISQDYERRRIFYSDIHSSSINMVFFNGTNHTVIVNKQVSVEGLAYEPIKDMLFWTTNSDASIRAIDMHIIDTELNSLINNTDKVQTIIRLNPHDKPRGKRCYLCSPPLTTNIYFFV